MKPTSLCIGFFVSACQEYRLKQTFIYMYLLHNYVMHQIIGREMGGWGGGGAKGI